MKRERMIQILIEAIGLPPDVPIEVMTLKSVSANIALTAMQRAVEEETATLRAELERLKGCEAIVRELPLIKAQRELDIIQEQARQWVKDNN